MLVRRLGDAGGSPPPVPVPALLRGLPSPYFSELVASVRSAAAARPGGVVDLARGNPEQAPPAHVLRVLSEAAGALEGHGYPPFAGLPELRQAFAAHHERVFGVRLDPEREVVVVPGTKTAIGLVCIALAQGSSVIVPDPGYADYPSGVALAGARLIPLPLDAAAGWSPVWDSVPAGALNASPMAFLNYPSNPCGSVARAGVFGEAVAVAERSRTALVHDLAYGELAWGPDGSHEHAPASFLAAEGAASVGVELVSMSKTWSIAGWRIGFVCGNAEIVSRVRSLLDHLTVGVPLFVQRGAIAALEGPDTSVQQLRSCYRRRAERVAQRLGVPASEGGYYTWLKLPKGLSTGALLHDHGVALAPGEGFGAAGSGWARLSVAIGDEQLELGLERLARAFGLD